MSPAGPVKSACQSRAVLSRSVGVATRSAIGSVIAPTRPRAPSRTWVSWLRAVSSCATSFSSSRTWLAIIARWLPCIIGRRTNQMSRSSGLGMPKMPKAGTAAASAKTSAHVMTRFFIMAPSSRQRTGASDSRHTWIRCARRRPRPVRPVPEPIGLQGPHVHSGCRASISRRMSSAL